MHAMPGQLVYSLLNVGDRRIQESELKNYIKYDIVLYRGI